METTTRPDWQQILTDAVNRPGMLLDAFHAFHNYSLGNQILAWMQCAARELPVGPLATYKRWQALGRQVRKGEKALCLYQPRTYRARPEEGDEDAEGETRTTFVLRPAWFVLAQTDGGDAEPQAVPGWDPEVALARLGITRVPFEMMEGNVLGYASPRERTVAINPVDPTPLKTLFHELAHVVLHADDPASAETADLPRNLREVEAEGVALLLSDALGVPGAEYSRGYIQNWWGAGEEIPARNASRIIRASDMILRAGLPKEHERGEAESGA